MLPREETDGEVDRVDVDVCVGVGNSDTETVVRGERDMEGETDGEREGREERDKEGLSDALCEVLRLLTGEDERDSEALSEALCVGDNDKECTGLSLALL